jgi:hypothetical protein
MPSARWTLLLATVAACSAPPLEVTGTVRTVTGAPAPGGVEVRLERLSPGGQPPTVLFTTLTDARGEYRIELFPPERPGLPLVVATGHGDERLRAIALGPGSDIGPASEAALTTALQAPRP